MVCPDGRKWTPMGSDGGKTEGERVLSIKSPTLSLHIGTESSSFRIQ